MVGGNSNSQKKSSYSLQKLGVRLRSYSQTVPPASYHMLYPDTAFTEPPMLHIICIILHVSYGFGDTGQVKTRMG